MKVVQRLEGSGAVMHTFDEIPINTKFNRNILIVGSSGSGKSFLGRILRNQLKPRLTLIYKEDNTYSDVVHVSDFRPDISVNPLEFLNSFNDSLDISSSGFMASQVMPLLASEVASHKNVANLMRGLKNDMSPKKSKLDVISFGLYSFIKQRLDLYYPDLKDVVSSLPSGSVLSFDGMSDDEQVFFSDYILRSAYRDLRDEVIFIDEVHRLKGLSNGVLGRIVREIRSRGALVGITQSLSDLPDSLINNFGTIYHFRSIHFRDLQKLAMLDPDLPVLVKDLNPHEFTEIQTFSEENKGGFQWIYTVEE